jgi:hypothetical protein
MLVKLLGSETTLAAATNVGKATVVRLYNTGSAALVTLKNADDTPVTLGTFTLAGGEVAYVEKDPTDTLEGGSGIKAVKVAYKN